MCLTAWLIPNRALYVRKSKCDALPCQIGEGFSLTIKIIKDMRKYYITADKIGEFVARMYAAGIGVDAEAQSSQLVVHLPNGGYE